MHLGKMIVGKKTPEERCEEIRAKIEAETKQIEQDRKEAAAYVIDRVAKQIEVYERQAKRLTGHAFCRNGVYLSALLKGKAALEKAFEEETKHSGE